ncbi:hypothetical protein IWT140_01450 [Secundilactobacillus pentosiphilus]|uniref:Uncharacterized protein n=1 Tax=Secundilactobacillus pentosiphilus TaxID=1714682 RepID=A0A1Z5IPX8_9LACO|nr:hypothetical protein IWT140_01450 [Secundilactobacillus pentosiphilus]
MTSVLQFLVLLRNHQDYFYVAKKHSVTCFQFGPSQLKAGDAMSLEQFMRKHPQDKGLNLKINSDVTLTPGEKVKHFYGKLT